MKRLTLFASALAASTALSSAADLYTAPPIVEPGVSYAPASFNWTGIYAGLHGGFGGDRFEYPLFVEGGLFTDEDINAEADITSSGFFGGGQIGANWQFAPNFVVGVEADAAWSDIKGELELDVDPVDGFPGGDIELGSKVNWFSTIRGRLGFLPTERLMVYGTGGLAVGETESYANLSIGGDGGGISTKETNWGWSAGAGFEYAVTNNITLKTEYLYVDLGSSELLNFDDVATLDVDTHFHTIKAGINYLWGNNGGSGADMPYYAPAATAEPFEWTGIYAGLHGGYGGNRFEYPLFIEGEIFSEDDINAEADITSSGFFGGGQIGANWQFAPQFVVGVEADGAWSDIKGELGSKVNWFSTLRARLGFLPTERLMVYGTGGAAVGETESYANLSIGGSGGGISTKETSWGWSAGAGFEYAVTNNITLKTEYLYVDLGSSELLNFEDAATLDVDTKFHTVKAGVNFLWN